jgi:predicted N-acyltransferase
MDLKARVIRNIDAVEPAAWNALTGGRYPYLRHEFLSALEKHGCLGREVGWLPRHLLLEDADKRLIAAGPMYLKLNSFGEFVFDWSWANAYQQAGLDYYPKLVIAAPFTPATGPRILIAPEHQCAELYARFIDAAIDVAHELDVSSVHWLFAVDAPLLKSQRLLKRVDFQFHWRNENYRDFDDFLSRLNSKRRKQIRKERRDVAAAGVTLERISGERVDDKMWKAFHDLYTSTFAKHGNYPALTLDFFRRIAATMGEQVLLVLASRRNKPIAAAFFLVGEDTLYGRYWGSFEDIPGLHFEACYYQGLDYCIARGLQRFEPGAQGEHKISRGFLPTPTYSMHWIADRRFRSAIARFLDAETGYMDKQLAELNAHSPYKERDSC